MIPIRDFNPRRSFPVVNLSIILICSLVWLYEVSLSENELNLFIDHYGFVPANLLKIPQTLLTHMFLHGGWLHIIGNMWFLWVFGDDVEDRLGKLRYLLFYTISGLVAAFIQMFVSLIFGGADIPMMGASGAISGVLGAYMWMFPHARILALVPLVPILFFPIPLEFPAVFFIGLSILIQIIGGLITLLIKIKIISGLITITFPLVTIPLPFVGFEKVAWFAHIGGFVVGYLLAKKLYRRDRGDSGTH